MSQEIGPLTLSERQLLMNTKPKASEWTEIGEVKITTTIFGAAKVSIVSKHPKLRRAIFWIALVVVAALAWVWWALFHPAEPPPKIEFVPPLSANGEANVLSFTPAVTPSSVISPPVKETSQSSNNQKNAGSMAAKPSLLNPLHKPPLATAVVPPRSAHPAASSQTAVDPSNKVEVSNPSARETLPVDPVKEKH
jgi:hypothetical protein